MRNFDELYFISDLHIGGEPGRQVFNQGANLAALIRYITEREVDRRVALVLGGDVIDFLSFGGSYLKSNEEALPLLEQVLNDAEFKQVFDALAELLRRANHYLYFLLGNHDLELALPAVRERLIDALCGQRDDARGRLVFVDDDGGLRCRVGPSRVVCTHGNEVDPWNLVDYVQLARRVASEERGLPPEDWQANAGTRLVIDVMNQVKRRFPFVELLKPEAELVPKILAVLDPEALGLLTRFAPIGYRLARGWLHQHGILGGGPEMEGEPSPEQALEQLLNPPRATPLAPGGRKQGDPLALAARAVREGKSALDVPQEPTDMLGFPQYFIDRLRGVDQKEALRRALLDWMGDEQLHAFDLDRPDWASSHLSKLVGPEVDFLIAGHTHLARALRRPDGGYYFNAGTWMRIVRLEKAEDLQPQSFSGVYDAIRLGTLEALDRARPQIVHTRPTVVVIESKANAAAAQGTLCELRRDEGRPRLLPIASPFTVGGAV